MMQTTLETITPEKATAWLKLNTANRPINRKHVKNLAAAIRKGQWMVNGETIKFSTYGKLIDGQHRLSACVQSASPFDSLVARQVDPSAISTVDCGKARQASHHLAMIGVPNATKIAAALKLVAGYERGSINYQGHTGFLLTNTDIDELLAVHPGILSSSQYVSRLNPLITPSVTIALTYLLRRDSPSLADDFLEKAASGAGLEIGNPVLALRDWCHFAVVKKPKPKAGVFLAVSIRAWNYFKKGNEARQLHAPAPNHKFPRIE